MKYHAALDLSGDELSLALRGEDGHFLVNVNHPMRGRDSALLADFIKEQFVALKVNFDQISHWTVGSGPGSFTGMRLAAALVSGLIFGRNTARRGVPGAIALAATAFDAATTKKVTMLFDGRNQELLVYELQSENGEFVPGNYAAALNSSQLADYFATAPDRAVATLSKDMPAVEKLLTTELFSKVKSVEHLDAGKLITAKYKEFDNDLTELLYIRPAVFPKK